VVKCRRRERERPGDPAELRQHLDDTRDEPLASASRLAGDDAKHDASVVVGVLRHDDAIF
jgi:hypothetical protein